MYESRRMQDLLESVKRILNEGPRTDRSHPIFTHITPKLEKCKSLVRRINDFSDSDDNVVREFLQNIGEVLVELDVIIKNKKVNPASLKVLQGVHEALAHNNRKVQEIWNGTSKTSGNFIANSFKKLIPTVISQVEIAKQEDLKEENLTEAPKKKTFPVRWREATIKTDGSTLYARTTDAEKSVPVKVTKVELVAFDNNFDGWNLAVKAYFDKKTWNIGTMGDLVTDKGFEKNFRDELERQGYPVGTPRNLSWAEQGMQGKDYVLFDIYSGGNNKGIEKQWMDKLNVPEWEPTEKSTEPKKYTWGVGLSPAGLPWPSKKPPAPRRRGRL